MKTFLITTAFLSFILTGYSQEFVNKITGKSHNQAGIKTTLDYVEYTEDEDGEPITTLYFKYIPIAPTTDYSRVMDWSTLELVDKATGTKYKGVDGHGIPLTLKSAFSFYNRGGEIGFQLSFRRLPESTRSIDVLSQGVKWFKDVPVDPERDDDNIAFRWNYFFKSLQFFTSVPGTIFFTMDGYYKNDLYINQHYSSNSRPKGCEADGIITFAYPTDMKDKEISIKAEAYNDDQLKSTWRLEKTPSVTTCSNFIHLSKS